MKKSNGTLAPYSFGHKWKDGRYVAYITPQSCGLRSFSLRTDIPLKALNLYFGVNFSIVSQVNPHINLFFFSSRGAVGRPGTYESIQLQIIAHPLPHSIMITHDRVIGTKNKGDADSKISIVTHRRGRGWRGGYLGSAVETYLYVLREDSKLSIYIIRSLKSQPLLAN